MLIVDSSAWIDFFAPHAAVHRPHVDALRLALLSDQVIGLPDVVRLEVLSGVRDDAMLARITRAFDALTRVRADDADWDAAAALYRHCRRQGVTVRSVIDCLIAQLCLREGASLLAHDRDFARIAEHTVLRLDVIV